MKSCYNNTLSWDNDNYLTQTVGLRDLVWRWRDLEAKALGVFPNDCEQRYPLQSAVERAHGSSRQPQQWVVTSSQ
jgi:hypothetical protein